MGINNTQEKEGDVEQNRNKTQVSVTIDAEIKDWADVNHINLSGLINDLAKEEIERRKRLGLAGVTELDSETVEILERKAEAWNEHAEELGMDADYSLTKEFAKLREELADWGNSHNEGDDL